MNLLIVCKAHLLKIIEEKGKKFNDMIRFQELINQTYLSKRVINFARNFFCNLIEEENHKNLIKHNRFNQKNLSHNQKKLKESRQKCDPKGLTCLTFIEFNKITKKNHLFFSFKPNIRLIHLVDNYFSKKSLRNGTNEDPKLKNSAFDEKDNILIGRHNHICKKQEEPEDELISKEKIKSKNKKNTNTDNKFFLQNYIAQSVKTVRDYNESPNKIDLNDKKTKSSNWSPIDKIVVTTPRDNRSSGKNNLSPFRYSFHKNGRPVDRNPKMSENNINIDSPNIYEESISDLSAYLSPTSEKKSNFLILTKKSSQMEHSVIVLGEESSEKSDEFEDIYEKFDPDNLTPRESIMILKTKKVYNNLNKQVLDKYLDDIEHSESFDFVNKFFAQEYLNNN